MPDGIGIDYVNESLRLEVALCVREWSLLTRVFPVCIHTPSGKPSSWGNLPSGTWPETYPFDVCSWGAYMRFHGAKVPAGG
jgi:hypothetical protein